MTPNEILRLMGLPYEDTTPSTETFASFLARNPDLVEDPNVDFDTLLRGAQEKNAFMGGNRIEFSSGPNQLWHLDPLGRRAYHTQEIQPGIRWGADPNNDTFSGKDGARDLATIAAMFGAAYGGGLLAGGETAAAGAEAGAYGADAALAGGEGTSSLSGEGMWDFLDEGALYDEWSPAAVGDSYGGSEYFDPAWADEWSPAAVGDAYGGASMGSSGGVMEYLKGAGLIKSLLGGGGASAGRGILNGITGDPASAAFNSLPFLLALTEANRQENTVAPILARTSALSDSISPDAVRSAALGPYNRETSSGLDRLTSSLTSRGVMGSSFGDSSIADYKTSRDVGAGELGTKAALGAVGTSGALLDQILRGTNAMNANRNLMLGAGLNASGRLFEPQRDPFGLRNLLGAI